MLWIPEQTPPQIDESTKERVLTSVLEYGLLTVAHDAVERLKHDQEIFGNYIAFMGSTLDDMSTEGPWPSHVFTVGAAMALRAYDEADCAPFIDQTSLTLGGIVAAENGDIPATFAASLCVDLQLVDLNQSLLDSNILQEETSMLQHTGGFKQIFELGAGCTRFYLQQSLAA